MARDLWRGGFYGTLHSIADFLRNDGEAGEMDCLDTRFFGEVMGEYLHLRGKRPHYLFDLSLPKYVSLQQPRGQKSDYIVLRIELPPNSYCVRNRRAIREEEDY